MLEGQATLLTLPGREVHPVQVQQLHREHRLRQQLEVHLSDHQCLS